MNSKAPLPQVQPIKNENITVNTAAIDMLLKSFISELFNYHHQQTRAIIEQNVKLVEENKRLVGMLRVAVSSKRFDPNDSNTD